MQIPTLSFSAPHPSPCRRTGFHWASMVAGFSGSTLLVFLFLTSLLFSLESMPKCVRDCDRKFANENALSRHRKICPVLEVVRQRSREIQKDRGISGAPKVPSTILSRKQRLQVSNLRFIYHNPSTIAFRYCRHTLHAQHLQEPWLLLLWRLYQRIPRKLSMSQ